MSMPEQPSAEFAAGVATATAAQASEDATEAEVIAEGAASTAEVAIEIASEAESAAWDARAAIEDLRSEMAARFDELGARISVAEVVAVEAVEAIEEEGADSGDEITPPEQTTSTKPAPVEDDPSGSSGAPKKKAPASGYGARWIQPRG
jgi:hypothetical protein